MTYLWEQNNIQNISMRLARKNVQGILKINYTIKESSIKQVCFQLSLELSNSGWIADIYGNSIPQRWGSDSKGPLTVGLSTGANRDEIARRTHITCPQVTGRNIQGDEIVQIGWGNTVGSLVCEEEDFELKSLINRKPMKLIT